MFNLNPILAAVGGTISLLFMVIAIISWLWSVLNGNQNAPGAGQRAQPQPGGRKVEPDLQAEINRFLKNVMGQKQGQEEELEVLVVEDENAPPRRRQKSRSKAEAAKRKSAAAQSKPEGSEGPGETRPGGRISQRKGPGSTTLGSSLRQHVAEHMQEGRVLQQTQNHLAHGVSEKVQQDLGAFTGLSPVGAAATVTASRQTATALSVAKLMRDPVSLKEAFVLNLILDRPKFGKK